MSNAYDAPDMDAGPPEPGGGAPEAGGLPGPPQGGAGLLGALRSQQQGPQASTPGPGNQSNAMVMLQNAVLLMERALPNLRGHPLYTDVTRILQRFSRHLSQGPATAPVQQTSFTDFAREIARSAMLAQLRGRQGPGGGSQMAQPPNPSTPLPGA